MYFLHSVSIQMYFFLTLCLYRCIFLHSVSIHMYFSSLCVYADVLFMWHLYYFITVALWRAFPRFASVQGTTRRTPFVFFTQHSLRHTDARCWAKLGCTVPKWDNPRTFQIRFKSNYEMNICPGFISFGAKLTSLGRNLISLAITFCTVFAFLH